MTPAGESVQSLSYPEAARESVPKRHVRRPYNATYEHLKPADSDANPNSRDGQSEFDGPSNVNRKSRNEHKSQAIRT